MTTELKHVQVYIRKTICRLCMSSKLQQVITLTPTPPANAFVPKEKLLVTQECFPLNVHLCLDCKHVQLVDIVNPSLLFSHYVYTSGAAPAMVSHLHNYAQGLIYRDGLGIKPGDFVVEAGSNDGTFLRVFKDAGFNVLGIDPAENIAAQATAAGIQTWAAFFNVETAKRILKEFGPAKLICANHVFAHVADMQGFIDGIRLLLAPDGVLVFEVGYLVDVYEKATFDTIYHEHLDYHTVGPLRRFFALNGMQLINANRQDIQGGALRGYATLAGQHCGINNQWELDAMEAYEKKIGLNDMDTFKMYNSRITRSKNELVALLTGLKSNGLRIAAYGAAAKATTLMYHFGLDGTIIDYIIDDSPLKIGLYSPGLHIPVVSSANALYNEDVSKRPDYVVILAWNFAESIIARHPSFKGRFIIPLPNLRIH